MIPKLRSILREQGKGVDMSQDFFKESVQRQLQETLQLGLSEFLAPKGLQVETVLIRDVQLPDVIRTAITETKKREQEVLKQQAELQRFATEQDQKVKQAESELKAARLEAQKIKELADAEAYKINVINKTLARSPNYIELKKVEQWNGVLPVYTGGNNIPMLDLRNK
jgi:regulator of protease activity HflC (stomatin/prohibitin superfamily)